MDTTKTPLNMMIIDLINEVLKPVRELHEHNQALLADMAGEQEEGEAQ